MINPYDYHLFQTIHVDREIRKQIRLNFFLQKAFKKSLQDTTPGSVLEPRATFSQSLLAKGAGWHGDTQYFNPRQFDMQAFHSLKSAKKPAAA